MRKTMHECAEDPSLLIFQRVAPTSSRGRTSSVAGHACQTRPSIKQVSATSLPRLCSPDIPLHDQSEAESASQSRGRERLNTQSEAENAIPRLMERACRRRYPFRHKYKSYPTIALSSLYLTSSTSTHPLATPLLN